MQKRLEKAAVLGSGVMGSGIAAHLASAGVQVHLLDIVPRDLKGDEAKDPKARNRLATSGIQNALKSKPALFLHDEAARLITPGNFDDHMDRIADCDLVIEAVVERLDIKTSLFEKVAGHLRDDAILASNTSGLSIKDMSDALPGDVQKRFVVMHFFNPVRYMRLLEVVPGPKTDSKVTEKAAAWGEYLGKGIVYGKDTTNFVANRIGVYGMLQVMHMLKEDGYTIEEADKIAGRPMGRPKSAAFRTGDIVGIDTLLHVAKNCYDNLTDDDERDVFKVPEWVSKLVESGRTGQKTGAGFYKKEGKNILVLDIESLEYREQEKVRFDSLGEAKNIEDTGERLKMLVGADDKAGKFAWKVTAKTLCYAAKHASGIADDVVNIDRAMRWGFNWDLGPFEMWDAIGVPESVARMQKEGMDVPKWVVDMLESGTKSFYGGDIKQPTFFDFNKKSSASVPLDPKHIRLEALKADKKNIVADNMGATLIDLGDGALCLEFHTKMNTVDGDIIEMMNRACDEAEKNFEALVIANDGDHFSAGANLMLIYMGAQQQQWDDISNVVTTFQSANQRVRYCGVPVVSAPFQYTFGGGAEVAMSADATQAFAETYMGLVEVGVGLVPAGAGCMRMAQRWSESITGADGADVLPLIGQASLNIAMATVGTGAGHARKLRYLRPTDGVTLNRDHLLYHAKQRALGMARAGYRPPIPPMIEAAGLDAAATIYMRVWGLMEGGFATEHDGLIAKKVVHILCGGDVAAGTPCTEQHYLELEREAFLSLCGEEKSQARMQSILMTNRPLRN